MNWEAIGAIGEIVGAVAVVATLFYLAVQVRQNSRFVERSNEYANATSMYQSQSMYVQVFSQLAQDAELAAIYSRALKNEPLPDADYVRFSAYINTYFAWVENMYTQAAANLVAPGFKDNFTVDFFSVVGPHIFELISTSAGRKWWSNDTSHQFMPEFVDAVDKYLADLQSRVPEQANATPDEVPDSDA
jgi:hypothetical protein